MNRPFTAASLAILSLSTIPVPPLLAQEGDPAPIPIASLEREEPVDFAKEIYPLLKKNCIACHNSSKAKAQLNLESPQSILKGGSDGPAIVPGKPEESFLLLVAAHREDPIMPPEDNKANAVPFTPEELGFLERWIAEGAKGEALIAAPTPTDWILPGRSDYPVYHLALGPDDRYVAASRGQRVFLYDILLGRLNGELLDPALEQQPLYRQHPPAHRDFVQSLAFSADGWIATGGFRTVKLWRPLPPTAETVQTLLGAVTALQVSPDSSWAAAGDETGHVRWWKVGDAPTSSSASTHSERTAKTHDGAVKALAFSGDGRWLGACGADGTLSLISLETGEAGPAYRNDHGWNDLVFVTSPSRVVAASASGEIAQWLLEEPLAEKPDPDKSLAQEGSVTVLAPDPADPSRFYSAGEDGLIKHWNSEGSEVLRTFEHGQPILDLAVSPDGGRLLSISASVGKRWNAGDGTHLGDLGLAPEKAAKLEQHKRRHQVTQALVAERKKRGDEQEKAWKEEVEKAKKAATDRLAAMVTFDEADRALHDSRLAALEIQAGVEKTNAEVAALKNAIEAGEARVAELEAERVQRREEDGQRLAELASRIEEGDAAQAAATEGLEARRDEREQAVAARERTREALSALREVSETFTQGGAALEAIVQTENLLADLQQNVSGLEAAIADEERTARERTEQLATWRTLAEETSGALDQLDREVEETTGKLTAARDRLPAAESAVAERAEALKKAEEEAQKAVEALAAARKAFDQAIENEALALRLSERAAGENTRAQAALALAESQLASDQKAIDGATEADSKEEAPTFMRAAYSPDGQILALGRSGGGLLLFAAEDGRFLNGIADTPVPALAGLKGHTWLVGTPEKEVQRWEPSRGWAWERTLGSIEDPGTLIDRVTSVAFNPNGTLLATGSGVPSRSGEVKIWRVADGSLLQELVDAHSDTVVGMEFAPDGRHLATASTDRFAKVFSVGDGALTAAFEGHTGHVLDVCWRGDGLVLATAGADNVVKLWDFEQERQIKTMDGFTQEITSVAFADTGEKLLTSSGDKSIRLGGERLDGKEFVYDSALSRDGEWLIAAAQDSVVRVWKVEEKQLVQEFGAPDGVEEEGEDGGE